MLETIIARMADFDDTLLTKDAADLLGVHPETIRRLIYSGKLQYLRYEGDFVIAKPWLLEYVRQYGLKPPYQDRLLQTKENVIRFCAIPRTYRELLEFTGYYDKSHLQRKITRPLLREGKLRLTMPEAPHHNGQQYISVRHI